MKVFFLTLFILIAGTFIYLKVQILGDPNTAFNSTTRYSLGHFAPVRSVLGMHSAGDAQKWFLDGKTELAIEVVQARGTRLDEKALNNFTDEVSKYLNRKIILYSTETIQSGKLSDEDLQTIAKGARHHVLLGQPNLFIIYAEDFNRSGDELGKTVNEYGMVLSDTRLKELTSRFTSALPQYQQSTMLHEFGHQVGLEHNEEPGCIMNASVDNPKIGISFNGLFTPISFCDYELKQLKALQGPQ